MNKIKKLFLAIIAAALLSSCASIKSNDQWFNEQNARADITCYNMGDQYVTRYWFLENVEYWSYKEGLWRIKIKNAGFFITSLPCTVNHAPEKADIGR